MGWQDAPEVGQKSAWESAPEVATPKEAKPGMAALGGVNRGIAGLAGLPVDTIANVIDLAKAGAGAAYGGVTGKAPPTFLDPADRANVVGSSEFIANRLQRAGINTQNPSPQDPLSRALYTGGTIAGGSLVPGARPVPVALSAAAGAAAEASGNPEWVGPASMAPGAISQARNAMMAGQRARVAENLRAFEEAGTTPSVGQATESTFFRGLENLASKFPGGVDVFKRFSDGQQAAMGARARTGVSAEDAGRAIDSGVGNFLTRTQATWKRLDADVAAKMPPNSAIAPNNSVQTLTRLTTPVQGAEKTTGALVNPKLGQIREAMEADLQANNGVMPYEALRSLRTRVGSMLDDALVSDVPKGELKQLYGALSRDMEAAANAAGVGKEFARQNKYYASRMDRIENVLERVVGKGRQPEEIFNLVAPKDPDQVNKLRQVMRSLDPSERQVVSDAIVNRLGRATPGKQNEVSEKFSSETFLTNWAKLGPDARAQIFPDANQRASVEAVAKAAANLREGGEIGQNRSGSGQAVAAYSLAGGAGAAIVSGNVPALLGIGGAIAANNIGARMLTNPKVVRWLAEGTRPMSDTAKAAHLARLSVIYNEADEPTRQELSAFINR